MRSRRALLALLIALMGLSLFARGGALEANIMEARSLTTAREMLEKRN